MPVNYKKILPFIRKGVDPYVFGLRRYFSGKYDSILTQKDLVETRLENEILTAQDLINAADVSLNQKLTNADASINTKWKLVDDAMDAHIANRSDPHNVKFSQTSFISGVDPTNAQGVVGDTWLTYLSPSYYYAAGAWGECSVPCGGGIQYRPIQCTRDDGTPVDNSFCTGLIAPATSRACNTQPCSYSIGVYVAVDDNGIITPCDSNGNPIAVAQPLYTNYADKVYTGVLATYNGFLPYNGYYYFRITVTNAGTSNNAGFSLYWPNNVSCELVWNITNSFVFYPNGFNDDGWLHVGPWWRYGGSYSNATAFFRIPVQ